MNRTRTGTTAVIITILLVPLLLNGQYRSELPEMPDLGLSPSSGGTVLGFLDPSRLDFQSSYSMQISSSGNRTTSLGLVQSTFEYYVNPQVSVRGHIGLLHDPLSNIGPTNQEAAFLRAFNSDNIMLGGEISYRPTENMLLQIGFSQQPVVSNRYLGMRPYPYRGPR